MSRVAGPQPPCDWPLFLKQATDYTDDIVTVSSITIDTIIIVTNVIHIVIFACSIISDAWFI